MANANDAVRPPADTTIPDAVAMIESAQQAAAGGDYVAAEQLLRDAAALQESTLGAFHPDLASTLNNLAFVCERTNKIDEAERGYRRAHAIAVKSLAPRHPFVATSLKNLVDFCAAHDIPIWTPPDELEEEPPPLDAEPVMRGRPWLRIAGFAAVALVAIVIASFAIPRKSASVAPAPVTPAPVTPAPIASAPAVAAAPPVENPTPPETREAIRASGPVTVLHAQLCSDLEKSGSPDWQCTPVNGVMNPGTYVFYTRLLTTADTTVEHRWYHNGRVHQVMRLRVAAGPRNGYRTFSSNRVIAERAGEWKVELRSRDGALLAEERLAIRSN